MLGVGVLFFAGTAWLAQHRVIGDVAAGRAGALAKRALQSGRGLHLAQLQQQSRSLRRRRRDAARRLRRSQDHGGRSNASAWRCAQATGVKAVQTLPEVARTIYSIVLEGNLKWRVRAEGPILTGAGDELCAGGDGPAQQGLHVAADRGLSRGSQERDDRGCGRRRQDLCGGAQIRRRFVQVRDGQCRDLWRDERVHRGGRVAGAGDRVRRHRRPGLRRVSGLARGHLLLHAAVGRRPMPGMR